ncbi:MAG: HAD family phosphatase [Chloroflexi bacterium]|nr:HAD family phosphatase [Chloroflexota bacterium]
MTSAFQLIAIDLDGTLLDSQHRLTPRTKAAVWRAAEAGLHVVIATGRPRFSGYTYAEQLGLKTPGVYLQGLAVYDGDGTLLHQITMQPETARRILRYALDHDLAVMVYNHQRKVTARHLSERTKLLTRYGEPMPDYVDDLLSLPDQMPISKLIFLERVETADAVRRALQAAVGDAANVFLSQPDFVEALPPNASKGAGLAWLIAHLGVPAERVLAIGDGENDIEMLQLAGFGVAMANAAPRLKAVADFVTRSNDEDGVAYAIERFIFGEEG